MKATAVRLVALVMLVGLLAQHNRAFSTLSRNFRRHHFQTTSRMTTTQFPSRVGIVRCPCCDFPSISTNRRALAVSTLRFSSNNHANALGSSATTNATDRDDADTTPQVPRKFVNFPFAYHQEIDITIESLTNRGWGVGRYAMPPHDIEDAAHGRQTWVVMVPNVIPGERVRVRVFRNMKSHSEADLLHVLEPSTDRVRPACPLANECGGCQLQHMHIDAQRRWKQQVVQEALQQYKLHDAIDLVAVTLGTSHVYEYRSKLTPHYGPPVRRRRPQDASEQAEQDRMIHAIGFQKQASRQILDVPSCPIATPQINARYQELRHELLQAPTSRKLGATLLLRQGNIDDAHVATNSKEQLTTNIRGMNFTYLAGNFFQNNYHVVALMVEHVVQAAAREINEQAMTHLVDCYCGSGLFAVSCAPHFAHVIGIEVNERAVQEAFANAVANNVSCQFQAASAENIFANITLFPRDTCTVVLDPPRKGCSEAFLQQLYAFAPRRVVYMSCDPITQARDAAGMVGHGYQIKSVQPFDLFPQTRHIECLMVLELR